MYELREDPTGSEPRLLFGLCKTGKSVNLLTGIRTCDDGNCFQMNGITHYLDLSQVYGSDSEALGPLREWSGGRMKMFNDFGRELLPLSEDKNDCITMEQGSACFKSG